MDTDRLVRIWTQVGQQSQGAPISMAHVCAAAVAAVGVDGAGVTVMVSATVRETVHATDGIAARLEELQLMLGEGPCMDAFTDGGPPLAADRRAIQLSLGGRCSVMSVIRNRCGAVVRNCRLTSRPTRRPGCAGVQPRRAYRPRMPAARGRHMAPTHTFG